MKVAAYNSSMMKVRSPPNYVLRGLCLIICLRCCADFCGRMVGSGVGYVRKLMGVFADNLIDVPREILGGGLGKARDANSAAHEEEHISVD